MPQVPREEPPIHAGRLTAGLSGGELIVRDKRFNRGKYAWERAWN